MKALKGKLKEWSNTSLGYLRMQKVQILNELAVLDTVMENRILTESEAALKATLLTDHEKHLKNKESIETKIKHFGYRRKTETPIFSRRWPVRIKEAIILTN